MDARTLLEERIVTLLQELGRAENALKDSHIPTPLRERVQTRFNKLIHQQRQALHALEDDLERELPLDICWSTFSNVQQACTLLFQECLAFVEGALVRGSGVDAGLCALADTMLDEISQQADIPWGRFTILAPGEFYGDIAAIIRLRFPEVSIWNLPVALHEFGHYVAQELRTRTPSGGYRHPFQQSYERELRNDMQQARHMHEFFADLFALYSGGPAYAFTSMLVRFDPRNATRDSSSHPSAAQRAHWQLQILRQIDAETGTAFMRPYSQVIEHLETQWQQALAAAGQTAEVEAQDVAKLEIWLEQWYALLASELPDAAYGGWLRAQALAAELQPNPYAAPALQEDDSIRDVLNAAWLARIQADDSAAAREIGQRAQDACQLIAQRKGGT